jgi:hypothetical protein
MSKENYFHKIKELPEITKAIWWLGNNDNNCNLIFCYFEQYFW